MSSKPAHILVVDDELSMRELLELMLAREGDRRPLHQRLQLGESDKRAGKGDGTNGETE